MNIENIKKVRAQSSGVIEVGWVTLYINDEELQFNIEQHSIRGGYEFQAYVAFGTDLTNFDINVDEETNRVLDEELLDFIEESYKQNTI